MDPSPIVCRRRIFCAVALLFLALPPAFVRAQPLADSVTNTIGRGMVNTGPGRRQIFAKLKSIRVDQVNYPGVPLKEVLDDLTRIAKTRDPDGQGINFYFSRALPANLSAGGPAEVQLAANLPELESVKVKVALNDVKLGDLLDAITKTSDVPIRFSVLDYAIVFYLADPREPGPYEIRTYHVDPNTFLQGLESVYGAPFGNGGTVVPRVNPAPAGTGSGFGSTAPGAPGAAGGSQSVSSPGIPFAMQSAARQYFAAVGINLNTNADNLVYDDRQGSLTIRAPADQQAAIKSALDKLNAQLPATATNAPFAAGDPQAPEPQQILNEQPNLNRAQKLTEPASELINIKAKIVEITQTNGGSGNDFSLGAIPLDPMASNALVRGAASTGPIVVVGILTGPQYHELIRAWEQRDNVDVSTAPEVTTEPGTHAQLEALGFVVTTPYKMQAGSSGAEWNLIVGSSLDIIAQIGADEFSLNLTVVPQVLVFLGHDLTNLPDSTLRLTNAGRVETVRDTSRLPHLPVRDMKITATVWDGRTLVIGGLTLKDADSESAVTDSAAGAQPPQNHERSGHGQAVTRTMLLFITPTLIHPDGTAVHSEDQMSDPKFAEPPKSKLESRPHL